MTLKEKQLEFIIYCIENTAERLGRYSADVYNKLKELEKTRICKQYYTKKIEDSFQIKGLVYLTMFR